MQNMMSAVVMMTRVTGTMDQPAALGVPRRMGPGEFRLDRPCAGRKTEEERGTRSGECGTGNGAHTPAAPCPALARSRGEGSLQVTTPTSRKPAVEGGANNATIEVLASDQIRDDIYLDIRSDGRLDLAAGVVDEIRRLRLYIGLEAP